MSSTGVSSSSTGAVADRFVGAERGRFGGRARLAWTVNEERAAEVFIAALLSAATRGSAAILVYFRQTSLIIRLRTKCSSLLCYLFSTDKSYNKTPHPIGRPHHRLAIASLANVVHSQACLRLKTVPSLPPTKNTRAVSYPSTPAAGLVSNLVHRRSVPLDP